MENTHDLRVLLGSRHPLLFAETNEEERFLAILADVAGDLDMPIWKWSATQGLRLDGEDAQYQTTDLRQALDFIGEVRTPAVFVLTDAAPNLADAVAARRLKEVALAAAHHQTLLVTGVQIKVPTDLDALGHSWVLQPPSHEELSALAMRTLGDFSARGFPVRISRGELRELAASLKGMTIREAERIIQRAVVDDGRFDADDLATVHAAKADILNQDGILKIIESSSGGLAAIGGLGDLKAWLALREPVFRGDSARPGLDLPKGILLTGVPGCGKSLVAKTIAETWGVPLILLDSSRLYAKYVGESEARLASALRTIEAMSPVVVWIDEIEKGFASSNSDGGVSARILGTFLRWLQDRTARVFAVATANDVSGLPPELTRRGRFDEIFFVDLPDGPARAEILIAHLTRREHDPAAIDIDLVAQATEGFSGAEIETAIVGATYRAFGDESIMDTESLLAEIATIVPLSVSRSEAINALRAWSSERAVAA